jgi:hypothetical protein
MPYRLAIHPPVLFVSWRGFTVDDLRAIAEQIVELRDTTGRKIAYFSRIPPGRHVFTEGEQEVLLGFLRTILPHCDSIHHVLEGDGFVKSNRLAIVTTLSTRTARPRAFHTHQTLEEGIRSIRTMYGVDLSRPAQSGSEAPPRRASGAFREAARIVERARTTPAKKGQAR